jgi:hypothetical protein
MRTIPMISSTTKEAESTELQAIIAAAPAAMTMPITHMTVSLTKPPIPDAAVGAIDAQSAVEGVVAVPAFERVVPGEAVGIDTCFAETTSNC